ncbi:hypothetical protein HPULCUR_007352 [Helicostylum pulchrum]|uniref:Transcription regulator Rua1 C-terminal domain-containing protein n=1 Tax=Helicostylum pulchrum TaxID=562976 RepID=A0ABP9Y4I3_9FUNG
MYNNNNRNLTAQPDIYAILNTDDPAIEGPIDTDALVKDIFSTDYSLAQSPIQLDSSTSTNSSQFNFNNDLINFDITDSHYTPTSNFLSPTYQETTSFTQPDFSNRRHSVAASSFHLRPYHHQAPPPPAPAPPLLFTPTSLAPVNETYHHRASMPNIFLPQQQQPRYNPNVIHHRSPVNFNPMPWSPQTWPVKQDLPVIEPRKRFYSQQLDNVPTQTCPLPMSGILSRRTSVATPNDIVTWNRMVSPDDRIMLQERKRRAESMHSLGENPFREPVSKKQKADVLVKEEETNTEDYPVITEADLEAAKKDPNAIPRRQKLRYQGDEYTPKWVRYTGQLKEGYCDTCKPGKWLQLKNSAYWYHKQFFHGISSVSGKPFQKPLEQRAGDHDVIEGLCHQCKVFVPICNSKRKNNVLWYRHAHKVKYMFL